MLGKYLVASPVVLSSIELVSLVSSGSYVYTTTSSGSGAGSTQPVLYLKQRFGDQMQKEKQKFHNKDMRLGNSERF
jgi:hypothetical protein